MFCDKRDYSIVSSPFILATVLSIVNVYSYYILAKPIMAWISQPSSKEMDLLQTKAELRTRQSTLNMSDNFAQYSKLQRKINAIDQELHELHNKRTKLMFTTNLILTYGAKGVLCLILICLSIYYRYTPVLCLDAAWDLVPFSYLISFPNASNTVSFHFWTMCCSTMAKLIKLK